ncbi:hypothetical protein N7454_004376 [Penicillium verhagenii]|nr:hypothetical protein N7454_004376 [Penicillium verhagenii]
MSLIQALPNWGPLFLPSSHQYPSQIPETSRFPDKLSGKSGSLLTVQEYLRSFHREKLIKTSLTVVWSILKERKMPAGWSHNETKILESPSSPWQGPPQEGFEKDHIYKFPSQESFQSAWMTGETESKQPHLEPQQRKSPATATATAETSLPLQHSSNASHAMETMSTELPVSTAADALIPSSTSVVSSQSLRSLGKSKYYAGFCKGAWKLQSGLGGFKLYSGPSGLFNSEKKWRCMSCSFQMPTAPGLDIHHLKYDDEVFLDKNTGIRFRWLFLAKSHIATKLPNYDSLGQYQGPLGCVFCPRERNTSTVLFDTLHDLLQHIGATHRSLEPLVALQMTQCILGRVADPEEAFDINIPSFSTSKDGPNPDTVSDDITKQESPMPDLERNYLLLSGKEIEESPRAENDLFPSMFNTRSLSKPGLDLRAPWDLNQATLPEISQLDSLDLNRDPLNSLQDTGDSKTNQPQCKTLDSASLSSGDVSDMSSTQTTITHPEQGDDDDHTSSSHVGGLDHILNAGAYYDALDLLEVETAELCGIGSGPQIQTENIDDCLNALRRARDGLNHLMSRGFCGETLNILVEKQSRPRVANAVHISLDELNQLISTIELGNPTIESGSSGPDIHSKLMGKLFDDRLSESSVILKLPGFLQFLSRIIPLGLLSFSGSHVCRFDINVWDQVMEEIPVGFGYSFSLRQLACLKDFVGGPAWVLRKSQPTPEIERGGLKVSLTVQDLHELWGPVSLVRRSPNESSTIKTERGFIVPLQGQSTLDDDHSSEVECHWGEEVPVPLQQQRQVLLSSTSRLLIGTPIVSMSTMKSNPECGSKISEIQQEICDLLQFPGTCNEYFSIEGHDIQFSGGQYVNLGLVIKHKRNPARTLKSALIAECLKPETDIKPYLKLSVGLEISACTGNAQRVTLWDALRLAQTKENDFGAPLKCVHAIADPACIQTCWTRYTSSSMDQIHNSFPDTVLDHATARQIIVNSILALQRTGVDPMQNLQAYWPFSDPPMTKRIEPTRSNKWLDVISDTRDTAAFAVISQRCLEFHEAGFRRSCLYPCRQAHIRQNSTCLSIRLLPRPVFQRERGLRRLQIGNQTSTQECDLSALSSGSTLRVGKRNLVVAKPWQAFHKPMIATPGSNQLLGLGTGWTRIPDFREQVNPDIKGGEPVEMVICSW